MTKQSTILNATQRNATQRNATQRNATQRNATQGLTAPFLHIQVNTDIPSHSTMGRYCHALCRVAFRVFKGGVLYETNTIPA